MSLSKFCFRDCEFVRQPSEDFNCPVCLEILQDPFLTACCGNHFCKGCVDATKRMNDRCPLCKETLSGIVDKRLQRQIHELRIYCLNKKSGCTWSGDLGKLEKHLCIGETDGECRYLLLPCSLSCGQLIFRNNLHDHVNEKCQLRSFVCEYCGYSSTYKNVTTIHHSMCPDYPVSCPNSCMVEKLQRSSVDEHRLVCPKEIVPCTFNDMGCEVTMQRHLLEQHITSNILQHQLIMFNTVKELKQSNEALTKENSSLKKDVETVKNELTTAQFWINGYKLLSEEVMKTNWRVYLPLLATLSTSIPVPESPVIIEWSQYADTKQNAATGKGPSFYYAGAFYTHPRGYKMQLRVYPNGVQSGKGTHLSVYCHVLKGENDDCLRWPFRGDVDVTLLNQLENNQHHSKTIWKSLTPTIDAIKKPDSYRNEPGWGNEQFIAISEVERFTETKQYLVNDKIYFRITIIAK